MGVGGKEREGVMVNFNFSITLTFYSLDSYYDLPSQYIQTRIEVTNIIFRFRQKIHLRDLTGRLASGGDRARGPLRRKRA